MEGRKIWEEEGKERETEKNSWGKKENNEGKYREVANRVERGVRE